MLRFNRLLILYIVLLTGTIILKMHFLVPVSITFIFVSLLSYGVFTISSGMFIKAVCKTGTKGILLTFDDGPDPTVTPQILEVLKKCKIKAVFFITGKKVAANPELVTKIVQDGHVVGNHTFNHSNFFPIYPVKKMVEEINRTSEIIEKTTGKKVDLFRPPVGITNPNVATAVIKTGKKVIGWSLRSLDTVNTDEKTLKEKILNDIREGDIVLFHDTQVQTAQILDNFIEVCIERGFEFVDADHFCGVINA